MPSSKEEEEEADLFPRTHQRLSPFLLFLFFVLRQPTRNKKNNHCAKLISKT